MTREQIKAQRKFIKAQHKAVSKERSRKQLDKAMFKAKVGFIELFRAVGSFSKSIGIVGNYLFRDLVAFVGRIVVSMANKAHAKGHEMDWSMTDYNKIRNEKAHKLSHKKF